MINLCSEIHLSLLLASFRTLQCPYSCLLELNDDEFQLFHHVVYKYTCEKEGCNSLSYIGYTTCSLAEKFMMHTSTGSICKHLREKHQAKRIPKTELLENTKILVWYPDKRRLIIAEALLIKTGRPALNSQDEGSTRVLKIFIH